MKTLILTLITILGITASGLAQRPETLTLRTGQQKTADRGRIKIKFISVTEDSRCPAKAVCVWAGNAKAKIKITDSGGRSKITEVNTFMGPKGDQFGGYAINLTGLTQKSGGTTKAVGAIYKATFSVEQLRR